MHVPVAMAELTETTCADKTALDDIARRVACVNTSIIQVQGEILELQQYIERRTSYVEDGELRLTLNTILAHLSHLATANQVQDLECRLLAIEPSPASPSPFRSPHSACSLSPLPMTAPLTTFPLRSTSVPPLPTPALGHSDNEDDKENILPVTILPYNDALTPWADLLRSDLHISWEDRTWQTATYCGLSYEYFSVGPPHVPHLLDSPIDAAVYLATQNEQLASLSVKRRESPSPCQAFDHDDMILKRG
jgi:hypothetical protein